MTQSITLLLPGLTLLAPPEDAGKGGAQELAVPFAQAAAKGANNARETISEATQSAPQPSSPLEHDDQQACVELAVMQWLGLPVSGAQSIPSGSLRRRKPGDSVPVDTLAACADPVHLVADLDDAQLFPAECLAIGDDETTALLTDLNALVTDDELEFSACNSGQWVLSGPGLIKLQPATLTCLPAHALAHRNVAMGLPRASEAGGWRRLFTEVQMLLHNHPVNQNRAAAGQMTINAVWFWGAGSWPEDDVASDFQAHSGNKVVHTNDAWARDFCESLGVSVNGIDRATDWAELLRQPERAPRQQLIVDTSLYHTFLAAQSSADFAHLQSLRVQWLDQTWQPVERALQRGELPAIRVLDGEGRATIAYPQPSGWRGWVKRLTGISHPPPVFDVQPPAQSSHSTSP